MNRLFFTGVPGSRWSGVAQTLETLSVFNTSDRTSSREYNHGSFSGHKGAYFGKGMEFPAVLNIDIIDSAWTDRNKAIRIVKSHDWAYDLDNLYTFTRSINDKIMLIYRDSDASFKWWVEAGGFNISYPSYQAYQNYETIREEIVKQNNCILDFCQRKNAVLETFNGNWVEKTFGDFIEVDKKFGDVFVAIV